MERIQKILAQAGIASRRQSEELIAEGLVTVNGKVAKLGDKAEVGKDAIKVRGKLLHRPEALLYLAFYKPRGVISMLTDPQGRPTLADYLSKIKTRVFPVGRLDFNSEGLILLTNDGALAEKIQKSEELLRVYSVKVKGHPDAEMLKRLERVIRPENIQHKSFKPHSIRIKQKLDKKTMIQIVLKGAGSFNLKELFDDRGFLVEKTVRTMIGHLSIKGLQPGEFRHLKQSQLEALIAQPELASRVLDMEKAKADAKEARIVARTARTTARTARIAPVSPRGKTTARITPRGQSTRVRIRPRSEE